ncbi:activating signal cointegrator 1 complex subunit 2-like [Musca vetustissima]|uniref:activating signal cointegrator 1 complex subunit 2-like n=1 Tax=Musca vetustissima TaxID=27455 RepID=UPI002AB64D67|nr:activating signal cointegrator 1 complex subunit 2-like [Musca vetustissima]
MTPNESKVIKDNPDKKSLKELTFSVIGDDGVRRNIPALDKHWAPRSIFSSYTGLVVSGGHFKEGAALEEWKHEAETFKNDMEFLLSLSQHEFWSYLLYQQSALAAIVSFLQKATPFYINVFTELPAAEIQELYECILNLILRIICRILSPKESNESWLKKDELKMLIYENYLVSIPMLFDLLVAVGNATRENSELLKKIFDNLLLLQPNYKKDLQHALTYFRVAFRSIHTQTENEGFEGAGGGLPDESCETPFDDVVLYTLDCAFTLSVLLDVCPAAKQICSEIKLAQVIANFYDNTLPFLYKNIYVINEQSKSLLWINHARFQFLKAFRCIAYSHVETGLMAAEEFIGLMTECLSEQTFVVDYERHYPLSFDVDILKQACPDVDSFKADFVVDGYRRECASAAVDNINNNNIKEEIYNESPSPTLPNSSEEAANNLTPKDNGNSNETSATNRDLELEVTVVLDCLPHLGTGFVRRVLSRYNNAEEAISAVLENNLPPDLAEADQTEVYIPPDPQDKIYKDTGVKHFNIFDGDKYDIMTQDNPQCIIKKGKGMPNVPKDAAQLLDDKRDLAAIRHKYQEYSLVTEGDDEAGENDEYNDEYDDSYEALLESETRVVKSKDMKQVLANVADESEDDENESEEEDTSQKENRKNMNFCENPEDIRARYEARRQAKWSKKGQAPPAPQNFDVVGKQKGQGQEKDVLRNRQKKEANKSSRANHNRKAGAAFKRSKGML